MRRRSLLLSGAAAGGALLVGWGLMPPSSRIGTARSDLSAEGAGQGIALNGWIRIAPDGTVRLAMPRSEMGQGVHTALAMLVAEELDLSLDRVVLEAPGLDSLYGNVAMFTGLLPVHPADREPGAETLSVRAGEWVVRKVARELGLSITGGSSSVADAWPVLRLAAATARGRLLGAASLQWRLPVAELACADGVISHLSGPAAHFGELAAAAAAAPPGEVVLKPEATWRLLGTAAPRTDVRAKSNGSAVFGIDTRQPGQLYAVIRHSPSIGGQPGRHDANAALRLPGVERVVRMPPVGGSAHAVAVIGRSSWHAERGARALNIEWRAPPDGGVDSAAAWREIEQQAVAAAGPSAGGHVFHATGDADAAWRDAARRIESVYRAPWLAHAALEPMNCTARVHDGGVEVWASTQVPSLARTVAAEVAGVDERRVAVHVPYLGGGFGRRLEVDVIGQAVRLAMETGGRPVQLVWSREDDFRHDFYRPAAAAVMQGGFDAQGRLTALRLTSAGDAIAPRWIERGLPAFAGPIEAPDKTAAEGLYDLPYGVPHQRIAHRATHSGVPVGYWRSVGHSHNAFFSEGFIDELAHAARQDPLAFRLALLQDKPRHTAVLKLAAERAGWSKPLPPGREGPRARGLALHESFGSIVAQVVEASVVNGRPRVHRVVCAADIGTVINPGIVAQQIEGAVIFGLSAALHGRIDIESGVVKARGFADQPLVTMAEAPVIETHLVPSTRAPAGVGEIGVPPLAPALAGALFALTGQRLRELPLRLATA